MKSFIEFIAEAYTDYDGGVIIFPYEGIKSKAFNLKMKVKIKSLVKKYNNSIKSTNKYDEENQKIPDFKMVKNTNTKLGKEYNKNSLTIAINDVNYEVFKKFGEFVAKEVGLGERKIAVVHKTMKSAAFV